MRDVRLTIVGGINQDVRLNVDQLPAPGETVTSPRMSIGSGGKGANQAAAAAEALGEIGRVRLVAAVGADTAGVKEIDDLAKAGVDVASVVRLKDEMTGRAFILVDRSGENSIILIRGANARMADLLPGTDTSSDLTVVQTEIGAQASDAAAEAADSNGGRVIINNAPVVGLAPATLSVADPLVVNEGEARAMLASHQFRESPEELAETLLRECGARSVIVTMGKGGSVVATLDAVTQIGPHRAAKVVDTTGAGDVYVGTLAAHLAAGEDLISAADHASSAAAEAVGWNGARDPRHATKER